QTALAEAEVEYQERDDTSVYVKFPIVSGEFAGKASIAIWTTTPWTLPANLAIAVDPKTEYLVVMAGKDGEAENLIVSMPLIDAFIQATGLILMKQVGAIAGEKLAGSTAQHPFLDRQ